MSAADMFARVTSPRLSKPMLVAALAEVRLRFAELAPEAERRASDTITRLWTMRELVAHMASWATEFVREVSIASRGEPFDYTIQFPMPVGPTVWNQREVDGRATRSFDDARVSSWREPRGCRIWRWRCPTTCWRGARRFR